MPGGAGCENGETDRSPEFWRCLFVYSHSILPPKSRIAGFRASAKGPALSQIEGRATRDERGLTAQADPSAFGPRDDSLNGRAAKSAERSFAALRMTAKTPGRRRHEGQLHIEDKTGTLAHWDYAYIFVRGTAADIFSGESTRESVVQGAFLFS
jgi:hypothetical protein